MAKKSKKLLHSFFSYLFLCTAMTLKFETWPSLDLNSPSFFLFFMLCKEKHYVILMVLSLYIYICVCVHTCHMVIHFSLTLFQQQLLHTHMFSTEIMTSINLLLDLKHKIHFDFQFELQEKQSFGTGMCSIPINGPFLFRITQDSYSILLSC